MSDMEPEPDEAKAQIGKSMRDLGFDKVNYQKQEKLDINECCIYYTAMDSELYTTESYVVHYEITIFFHEHTDIRIIKRVKEIMKTIEHDYVNSEEFAATTFMFGKIQIHELGTSYRAEIPCLIREEIDHD